MAIEKIKIAAKKFITKNSVRQSLAAVRHGIIALKERSKAGGKIDEAVDSAAIDQFNDADIITISSIAIMLSDAKSKADSPFITSMKKADIEAVLLSFCKDTYSFTNIEQLNELFSKDYYKRKVRIYLSHTVSHVKKSIRATLPKRQSGKKARKICNTYVEKICESLNTFESVKYIMALSGNDEISDSKRNYKLDHLGEYYRDALIYLVDVLLTCTCISKMLFVERMIRNIDENSEFYRIIKNMTQSTDNHNLIISKSRPIYKQYYKGELGSLNGDDLLYGMAITIMINKITKKEKDISEKQRLDSEISNLNDFIESINMWLDSLAVENNIEDIGTLILQKITCTIHGDYTLLVKALAQLTSFELYYRKQVIYYVKERAKERYLKGDFNIEKDESMNINDI